jgi:hypothetical protein
MAKYRKKPVEIEAIKWDGTLLELVGFVGESLIIKSGEVCIHTLEGDMRISVGDYVIKGVQGEFYPCKPDIFHETYEEVDEMKYTPEFFEHLYKVNGWD